MAGRLFGAIFKGFGWFLSFAGALALLIAILIATPLTKPAPLTSISETARAVDRRTMPGLERFHARDGTELAYRHYQGRGAAPVAILVHGSSGSSVAVHALAKALSDRGVETFAPDIRGHGGSGTRGDVGYAGQLEHDLADLVSVVRRVRPTAPLVLIGHSAGGGFALRMAGSPLKSEFVRTVLLAPFLGYSEPTNRPQGGGWASPDYPRIVSLVALRIFGIACCEHLPVVAFAVPPQSEKFVVATYSFRLLRDFAASRDFRTDLAATSGPVSVFGGEKDELMVSENYHETMGNRVKVRIVPGVNHMGIVSDPAATAAIADDVATGGAGS